MMNLDNMSAKIEEFIQNSIVRFQTENQKPNTIGVYCCSTAGWISLNYNINVLLSETENNCPDFEYEEYDFLDLFDLRDEYEKENPEFKFNSIIRKHNHNEGDEKLNEIIFEYLKPIVTKIKNKYDFAFLLQMLDSKFVEVI